MTLYFVSNLVFKRFHTLTHTMHTLETATDDWSDSEDEAATAPDSSSQTLDLEKATKRIKLLEKKLQQAKQEFVDYRKFVGNRLNLAGLAEALKEHPEASSTHVSAPLRDDDSHYFQSYGENGTYLKMSADQVISTYHTLYRLTLQIFTLS